MYQNVLLCLSILLAFSSSLLCIENNINKAYLYLLPLFLLILAYLFSSRRLLFTCISIVLCFIFSHEEIKNSKICILCSMMILILIFYAGYNFSKEVILKKNRIIDREVLYCRSMMIKCFGGTVDIYNKGLTKSEVDLLKQLCAYRLNNRELALMFNKSESTVKSQLNSIMNKIGADTRYQLIEMCQLNFI